MLRILIILFLLHSCTSATDSTKQIENSSKDVAILHRKAKIISDSTNILEGKIQELKLEYIVWGCACANWISPRDRIKYPDSISNHCIFLEPSDTNFNFQNYFDPAKHYIIVKGQFYQRQDYPKGTIQNEENLEKAKVFRYTEFRINTFDNKQKVNNRTQTISVIYNAIACTCAQWTETKYDSKMIGNRKYLYLERANNNIIDADSLWNGEHLPLTLQLTGRFISESGYPKNYSPTKGNPDPAKVFQYDNIKIISKKWQ